jgi:coenzyme F420-reducing hydrogenase delta subunit/NAD-dependent dihydropyrimidine dehydrogenase PreA subunit
LSKIPAEVPVDWFYLFFYPLYEATSPGIFWLTVTIGSLLLFFLPWLRRAKPLPKAEVLENCNGCAQCFDDCPYEAIYMKPSSEVKLFEIQEMKVAVVPQRCASCGICIGSCAFEAIKLSESTETSIKKEISSILSVDKEKGEKKKILGFFCAYSIKTQDILNMGINDMPDVKVMTLPCIGMVLPSMIEHALKNGAEGVFICGCKLGDCHYREGNNWLQDRLTGIRRPILKRKIDRSKIRIYWFSAIQTRELLSEIQLFQEDLKLKRQLQ